MSELIKPEGYKSLLSPLETQRAIKKIKETGAHTIKFMCVIACPEGAKALQEAYPDVEIYCGAMDKGLNDELYITPGIGDGGDRIFGTK